MARRIFVILLCALVLCLGACSYSPDRSVSDSGFYFDTIISIRLYGTQDHALIDDCFAMASRYEKLFSNTIENSEISQINQAAGSGEWTTVSPETITLVSRGLDYCQKSKGRFDITIGRLSSLWNISEISANLTTDNNEADASMIPDPAAIAEALSTVDYHAVEMEKDRIRLNRADAMLDLGAIAKGYIADCMKAYLVDQGITSAIINLGGNVIVIGDKPDHTPYHVGIQKPFAPNDMVGVVSVSDMSCVTSGVYERYFRVDDVIYHHILDLNDGYPCRNELYGVTIICPSSMDADALSTVCFSLGLTEGMNLIEDLADTEAIFVTDDMTCYTSSGIGSKITFRQQ